MPADRSDVLGEMRASGNERRALFGGPIGGRQQDGSASTTGHRRLGPVLVPNLGRRYSGVTSVIRATLPALQAAVGAELVGIDAGPAYPAIPLLTVLRKSFLPPQGAPFRIWHARRNLEMVCGLVMRSVLRQPVRIVFTSAALRKHTRFTKWLIRQVDRVIATSPEAAEFLDRPSVIIPHGIDCNVFHPVEDRAVAWAELGLGGRHGIGVFGRVRYQKGTDLFVAAMIRLLPDHPGFTGVVVGLAKPSEAEFLQTLKQRVEEAGLSDRIHFLGELPPDALPRMLASVSICVAPQRHEGFGLVPLEAAACGTPVVAARSGAAASIVEEGRTGLLVQPDDIDGLTTAIGQLIQNEVLRNQMGEAGRDRVARSFSIDREVESYSELYRGLWAR